VSLLDDPKYFKALMARLPERIDLMEVGLPDTEGKAKLRVQRFWVTDLGVKVVISLLINWEIEEGKDEDDYCTGDFLEYARDTVDLWSAAERERFIQYCRRRLKQISYLTWNWGPLTNPMEMDWVLCEIEDRIQMSIS